MTPTMHEDNDGVIYQGHVLDVLRTLDAESVDCCITSPPYWGLRSYKTEPQEWPDGWRGELGLEPDFNLYLDHIIEIFREVKRVLKKTGTLWVNLGDSYSGSGKGIGTDRTKCKEVYTDEDIAKSNWGLVNLPPKSLCQIPSRFAIRMSDDGWVLRNELIWYKRNCMPSSADDRFTVDFEKIFFFTKSPRYWFERQFEAAQEWGTRDRNNFRMGTEDPLLKHNGLQNDTNPLGRNKRCVTIANMSYMKLKNNLPVATKLHIINELIKKGLL